MVNGDNLNKKHSVTGKQPKIPVSAMVEDIIGCKWSLQLLILISQGCYRPSALLRACSGLSAKVMNERLRKMMNFGIIQREVFGEKPPIQVEYKLTPFGRKFAKIIKEISKLQDELEKSNPVAK